MTKKIVWMLVSCLMVLSLVIASCGPAEEGEAEIGEAEVEIGEVEEGEVEEEVVEEEKEMVSVTLTKLDGTKMEKMVEQPQYGDIGYGLGAVPSQFDPFLTIFWNSIHVYLCNEGLLAGDFYRSTAGTGECDFFHGMGGRMELTTGFLAESWELPDDETIIWHIRKGVHWWDKPPTNGREVTADDIVWTINRAFSMPECFFYQSFTLSGSGPTSVKALDKYTVETKFPPAIRGSMLLELGDDLWYFPPEPTETYGDMTDWKNAIGTGPWMLVDYVPGSSTTFDRNPNYWQKDPIFPENRLPYLDGIVGVSIPDQSTKMAAFRTGKLPLMMGQSQESFQETLKYCPEIEYAKAGEEMPPVIAMRMDKPESPFYDIRVRQALNMAVDKQEIIDEYYEGDADMLGYPFVDSKVFELVYRPLEEYPESVQMLFDYNPEKARELLAEAGYPDGFETTVQVTSGSVDLASLVREYFLDIDVDMNIEVVDMGAWFGLRSAKTFKDMFWAYTMRTYPWTLRNERNEMVECMSCVSHPLADEYYEKISRAIGKDDAEVASLLREIAPSLLERAWGVWMPAPLLYTMWWPWVENFYGIKDLGYGNQMCNYMYIWYDQALKESMGH